MEHSGYGEKNVVRPHVKAVRKTLRQAMQYQSSMGINPPLWFPRSPRGKTHNRRVIFFHLRIYKVIIRSRKKIFVAFVGTPDLLTTERHYEHAFEMNLVPDGFVNRQQNIVHD